MKAFSITPQDLLSVFLGQKTSLMIPYTGQLLIAANKNDQRHLPSEMAGAIVDIQENQLTLVSLVHPFKITSEAQLFEVDNQLIQREPVNWFGPQALVIEKKMSDFAKNYDGPRAKNGGIPRNYIPNEIAAPIILSDDYWQTYAQFVNDPDGSFAAQIKPMFD